MADWVPRQSWGQPKAASMTFIGSFRFDDPDGRAGMEVFIAEADGVLLHVPLSYRDAPLAGANDALICEMDHSVLSLGLGGSTTGCTTRN